MIAITTKPLRIALTGRMRSGKSFIADYIQYKYGFDRVSFAAGLKRVSDDLFAHLYEPIYEDCPFSDDGKHRVGYRKPRAILQAVGQKMREIDEDVWIKQAEQTMRVYENLRSTKGVVIDDLRQPNEYEWTRANGFIIIRVEASEDLRLKRAEQAGDSFSEEDLAHDTEQHAEGFSVDYTIVNDGDLDDLKRQVDEIMSEIKAKGGR